MGSLLPQLANSSRAGKPAAGQGVGGMGKEGEEWASVLEERDGTGAGMGWIQ